MSEPQVNVLALNPDWQKDRLPDGQYWHPVLEQEAYSGTLAEWVDIQAKYGLECLVLHATDEDSGLTAEQRADLLKGKLNLNDWNPPLPNPAVHGTGWAIIYISEVVVENNPSAHPEVIGAHCLVGRTRPSAEVEPQPENGHED